MFLQFILNGYRTMFHGDLLNRESNAERTFSRIILRNGAHLIKFSEVMLLSIWTPNSLARVEKYVFRFRVY